MSARILAVDDAPENLEILRIRLEAAGYEVVTAEDGEAGLARARETAPDLILLDVMMPKLSGIDVLRILKEDPGLRFVPVILLTARAETRDVVAGLDAGGDDYLAKPYEHAALMARVRAMLRLKALTDTVRRQAEELEAQRAALARSNADLETRIAEQVAEIERIGRLRRFLSPQIADLVAASGSEGTLLETHRREITVVFCDLRGFTAFTDTAAPEDALEVLRAYQSVVGACIVRHEGTLEHFAGDGIMVYFNDPVPCPDHPRRALRMALDLRETLGRLSEAWQRRGYEIGFGIGIATGYATLGQFGFEGRREYGALGSVTNLASRLCDEALPGQILLSQRLQSLTESFAETERLGPLPLKGFNRPMTTFGLIGWRAGAETGAEEGAGEGGGEDPA
ncbi:response regulator [Methylobacterium durans]|uniref:adenylate/guanylate cyclase domain-containing protein n=1 Tax=Methylobacterium durans TaxID=2202825 RepID=UPI002AFF2265|nr:response regulator [Methylobacterium durans]MEA1834370.1 response regulator [Methylobacterium durans]